MLCNPYSKNMVLLTPKLCFIILIFIVINIVDICIVVHIVNRIVVCFIVIELVFSLVVLGHIWVVTRE